MIEKRSALAKLKGIWRDQVFKDHGHTPATFKLAYALADMITLEDSAKAYRKTGKVKVWPSQEYLSKQTKLSPDTIRVGIRALRAGGHLKRIKLGNQHTGSNTYRLLFKKAAK